MTTDAIDDDAVLAALEASDETPPAEPAIADGDTEQVEVATTDTGDLAPEDEDAILAQVEAEDADTTPAPTSRKRGGKKADASSSSTPAVQRKFTDVAAIDDAALQAGLATITAKKVNEKAQNLIESIERGKRLSGFTALAVKKLLADGRVSSKTLVEAYQADGKSIGTARAQAQQMTALFKALHIATPDATDAKVLVLQDNALVTELAAAA